MFYHIICYCILFCLNYLSPSCLKGSQTSSKRLIWGFQSHVIQRNFDIVDKEVLKRGNDRGFQGQGFLESHACSSPFDPTADVPSISLNLDS